MLSSYRRRFPSSERSIVLFLCNTIWSGALHSLFRSLILATSLTFLSDTIFQSFLYQRHARNCSNSIVSFFFLFRNHPFLKSNVSGLLQQSVSNHSCGYYMTLLTLFACFLIKFHGPFKRIVCFVYLSFEIFYILLRDKYNCNVSF